MAKKRNDDEMPKELQLMLQWALDQTTGIAEDFTEQFRGAELSSQEVGKISNEIYQAMLAAMTRKHGGSH